MKKIITLVLVFCLALSLFACAKTPDNTNKNVENSIPDSDALAVPYPVYLDSYVHRSTDLFTATVIDSKKLTKNYFENYAESSISDTMFYTVEVKSVLRDFSVAENTKIYVARFVREADKSSERYFKPFEIGKTYLILGKVSLINDKPVIVDDGSFSVEIKNDGSLIPLSAKSEQLFKDTKTYDDFLNNKEVKYVIENQDINMPMEFYPLLETSPFYSQEQVNSKDFTVSSEPTDIYGVNLKEKEQIRKQIREAIPIDSKKTIEVPEK